MAAYPFQNAEVISLHRSQDVKIFPISNQPSNGVPVAFNVPVFQSQLLSSGQAVVGSNVNLQPFGGVPIATSISVPFTSSVVGSTELRCFFFRDRNCERCHSLTVLKIDAYFSF